MHVITITSKFMMPRKLYLELGFTKFSDKHCTKSKVHSVSQYVSECPKSTERATAIHSL